jgi:hypothetical protein
MTNRKEYAAKPATTPGPWHTRAGMSGVQICNDAGVCVARTPCFDRQAQADGAVLAAALDLLDAAKLAADTMAREDFGTLTVLPILQAAIAKAEGQS